MNTPQCFNCFTEIAEDDRICVSCGAPQWHECQYCGGKFGSALTPVALHESQCDENAQNSDSTSLLEVP